jgi:hypothetical protein
MPRMFLFAKHAAEKKIGGKKRGQATFSLKVEWLYVRSAACRGFPEDTLITCPQFFNELTYLDGNKEWDSHGRRQSADWR